LKGYYRPGDNYVICEECGFKRRASDVVTRWDNATVCKESSRCNDPQHPQELTHGVEDNSLPAVVTGEPTDVFIAPTDTTVEDL
jgi:hypothetical protein